MASAGYVYVLVNSATPEIVKIGKTARLPKDRAKELSSATGVVTPFVVAFEQFFEDCDLAEALIHSRLDNEGVRAASNREFFICSASYAAKIILELPVAALSAPIPTKYDPEFDRALLSLEEEKIIRSDWVEANDGNLGTGEAIARDQIREAKKNRALEILKICLELSALVEDLDANFPTALIDEELIEPKMDATAPALLSELEGQITALEGIQAIFAKCAELFDFSPNIRTQFTHATLDGRLQSAFELGEKASAWIDAYEYDLEVHSKID